VQPAKKVVKKPVKRVVRKPVKKVVRKSNKGCAPCSACGPRRLFSSHPLAVSVSRPPAHVRLSAASPLTLALARVLPALFLVCSGSYALSQRQSVGAGTKSLGTVVGGIATELFTQQQLAFIALWVVLALRFLVFY
jgi:hypothetical protein